MASRIITDYEKGRFTDDRFCFVVVGEAGAGKSTLINSITNRCITEAVSGAVSVTEEVNVYNEEIEVLGSKLKVRAMDTPGLNSTEISSPEVFKAISDNIQHLHALFCCFRIDTRFLNSHRRLLLDINKLYRKEIWEHTLIVLTHAELVDDPIIGMESFREAVVDTLRSGNVGEKVVCKIPFRLAAQGTFLPSTLDSWKDNLMITAVAFLQLFSH